MTGKMPVPLFQQAANWTRLAREPVPLNRRNVRHGGISEESLSHRDFRETVFWSRSATHTSQRRPPCQRYSLQNPLKSRNGEDCNASATRALAGSPACSDSRLDQPIASITRSLRPTSQDMFGASYRPESQLNAGRTDTVCRTTPPQPVSRLQLKASVTATREDHPQNPSPHSPCAYLTERGHREIFRKALELRSA
jgi:hypothetical protein